MKRKPICSTRLVGMRVKYQPKEPLAPWNLGECYRIALDGGGEFTAYAESLEIIDGGNA